MFKRILPISVVALLTVAVFLTGCGLFQPSFEDANRSDSGLLIEEMLPTDTFFLADFSTLDEGQRAYFDAFVAHFSEDPAALRDDFISGIDGALDSLDLSYVGDIESILGEDGLRFVMAMSESDGDEAMVMHAGVTLKDGAAAQGLLDTLESDGQFVKVTEGDYDVYFSVTAEEEGNETFYFGLYEDVFLIASDKGELLEMLDLARTEGAETLWTQEAYQTVIEELPSRHLAMMYMDGEFMTERRAELGATAQLASSYADYLVGQGFAFVATEEGLDFEGIAIGDKEALDLDEKRLDEMQAKKAYLVKEIPGNNLGIYMESYNLASAMGEENLDEELLGTLAILGIQSVEDFEALLSRGYALALHANDGFFPGVTVMIDMSEDEDVAAELMDTIDTQVTSMIGLFQFQGGAIAEALTQESVEIQGGEFTVIRLDVDAMMDVYDTTGAYALPEELEGQQVIVTYGLTKDERFVLSSYEGWIEDPQLTLNDMPDYEDTVAHLKGVREGVVYVDFSELSDFVATFQNFRDVLREDAAAIMNEADSGEVPVAYDDDGNAVQLITVPEEDTTEETTEVVEEVVMPELEPFDWAAFMEPLKSFAFSSDADKYEIEIRGVLLLELE